MEEEEEKKLATNIEDYIQEISLNTDGVNEYLEQSRLGTDDYDLDSV